MNKTITIRIEEGVYEQFKEYAAIERRSIANSIETLALTKLYESSVIDSFEMEEIQNNHALLKKLKNGHKAVKERSGRFVE
jgi:hypothetical protein